MALNPTRPAWILLDVEGDTFVDAVREHWPAMRRVAERLAGRDLRDDVLQDALADAWRARDRFDPSRGPMRAWLVTLTANRARKAVRKVRPSVQLVEIARDDRRADLDLSRAVAALPDRQREAVELYYFADLPIADVAAAMGCAEGTVKSTLSAARAALQAQLQEEQA